jgi:LPXTG-motif cell wall-anchored protein
VGGPYENTGTVTVTGDVDLLDNVDSADVLVSEILGIEILPETGMDAGALAWIAGLLLLLGAVLVRAVDARDESTF